MSLTDAPPVLSDTVSVDTPELVTLSYTIAGVGSRASAAIVDYLICAVLMLAVLLTFLLLGVVGLFGRGRASGSVSGAWAMALLVVAQFLVLWGYYVLFEALNDGQTPGKRLQRLRVVRDGGYSVDFAASAIRNLVRIVDMQPLFTYGVGIVSVALSRSGKRLGDMVAGTIVVREAVIRRAAPAPARTAQGAAERAAPRAADALATGEPAGESSGERAGPPKSVILETRLSDDQYAVLERFMERRAALTPERRAELSAQLAARLAAALPEPTAGGAAGLVELYEQERAARAAGAAGRATTGAARERHAIVAAGSARWDRFATRLTRAQRGGLRVLGEAGVREFVAEYRELAADLARLRTASRGQADPELFYLGRLVSAGHNLLYRGRRVTLREAVRFLAVDAPGEVRRSAGPILLAAFLLFAPAAVAYTAVVTRPETAATFLPESMLERAREGVRRAREGTGYIPDPQIFRPVMASGIIANNIQVAFAVFAGGISAGLFTLWLLVMNGVSVGGVFGLYASKGILPLLLAFVAPHGVLELAAISIAGGAGFLLAAALLMPGLRTRRAALVENGRRAIRLVAAATVLLIVAGSLEGFVSPIPWWPLSLKLVVSALTAVALYVYLRGPGPAPRERPGDGAPTRPGDSAGRAERATGRAAATERRAELLGLTAPPSP